MGSITTHTRRRFSNGVTSALLIGLIGLAACGQDDDSAESASIALPPAATSAVAAGDAAGQPGAIAAAEEPAQDVSLDPTASVAEASTGDAPGSVALPGPSPFGTALAITAQVSIQVADVRQAVIDLPALIDSKGGAIFDTDIAVGDPVTATATVTVKVPPTELESLITGLGGVGELVGRTQQTEDVADQIADTDARIRTAQASVDRVRALLEQAATLDDVVRIESELTVRETALEQLLASQRNLDDRVQLATLTIVISPTPADEVIVAPIAKSSTGVGDALSTGWRTFTDALHGLAVAIAYGAPFLGTAVVIGIPGWLFRARLRRMLTPAQPARSTVAAGPPPPPHADPVG